MIVRFSRRHDYLTDDTEHGDATEEQEGAKDETNMKSLSRSYEKKYREKREDFSRALSCPIYDSLAFLGLTSRLSREMKDKQEIFLRKNFLRKKSSTTFGV